MSANDTRAHTQKTPEDLINEAVEAEVHPDQKIV